MTHLSAAEPQLIVSDLAASSEFYTTRLGFAVAFSYGEPPFYVQVFRDGARLNLRHLDTPGLDPALRDREQLLSATITVDDAKALNLNRVHDPNGLMKQMLRLSYHSFFFWGLDDNLDAFAGYQFTLESGFPEEAVKEVIKSIPLMDESVGDLTPSILP